MFHGEASYMRGEKQNDYMRMVRDDFYTPTHVDAVLWI